MTSTAATLYRLRTGRRRGDASWGETKIYEGRDVFERDLLRALLEIRGGNQGGPHGERDQSVWHRIRAWLDRATPKPPEGYAPAGQLFAAEKLVGGEWVELCPVLVPPTIQYGEVAP